MAYKALYRKYRPDSFEAVVGQDSIIKTLQNIIKKNTIGHAYLFSGPRGTGKTSIAKLFAKSINCVNAIDGMACGKCEVCQYLDNDNSSDIIEIDAASNNGVDEIRELKSKVNLVPTKCKYKVYIIDEVHMLSMGAFNALLKTLEEPPKHVVFILATTEVQKIPLTILSRCQNFSFKKIVDSKIEERLKIIIEKEKINIEEDAIKEIAMFSDGGMRDAIGLLEQLNTYVDDKITCQDVYEISGIISNKEAAQLISYIINDNVDDLFETIDRYYSEGKDFIKINEKLIMFLRNILLYKRSPKYFNSINNKKNENYDAMIENFDESKIFMLINEINSSLIDMKNSNHPKILFEILLLKIINQNTTKKVEAPSINKKEKIKDNELNNEITNKLSENVENTPEKNIDELKEYKRILINNTIALAKKECLKEVEEKWSQLQTCLINKDLKNIATILLDAKIVAASIDHMILTYKYDAMVKKFDVMCEEIEELLNKIMNKKYSVVSLLDDDWQNIRAHYIKLKRENKEITILDEVKIKFENEKKENSKKEKKIITTEAINVFGEELIELKG